MAIIEHELVIGGGDDDTPHGDWEVRYDAQMAKVAKHLATAREMLSNSARWLGRRRHRASRG